MFRNATFFRFPAAIGMDVLCRLTDALKELPLEELGPYQMGTSGFTEIPGFDYFCHWIGAAVYVCHATRDRVINASTVAELTSKQVKAREDLEGRKVGGKERRRIREDVIVSLMPHAPIVTKRTLCLVHAGENWIAIDTASASVAEGCVDLLRLALGSFPARLLEWEHGPGSWLTAWLGGREPQPLSYGWAIGDSCVLADASGARAVYTNQVPLCSEEVESNLESGKFVREMRIEFREHVGATLTSDLMLKRIKFHDLCFPPEGLEDREQEMTIQALELGAVLTDIIDIFNCKEPES